MTYSEGNEYRTLPKWTIYVRDSNADAWTVLKVTEDKDEMNRYVVDLNDAAGYQRYAQSQHTVTV